MLREAACACGGIPVTRRSDGLDRRRSPDEQVRNAVPALDILVLNASVQRYVTLDEFDEAEFLREFQANVGAAFRLVQAFAPAMCERKHGRIIIVGSVNQFRPSPRLTVYSATKAALVSLTVNAAKSYAPHGVTVNNLVPGSHPDRPQRGGAEERLLPRHDPRADSGRRVREPGDCAGARASAGVGGGRYITGIELPVTGGMHL